MDRDRKHTRTGSSGDKPTMDLAEVLKQMTAMMQEMKQMGTKIDSQSQNLETKIDSQRQEMKQNSEKLENKIDAQNENLRQEMSQNSEKLSEENKINSEKLSEELKIQGEEQKQSIENISQNISHLENKLEEQRIELKQEMMEEWNKLEEKLSRHTEEQRQFVNDVICGWEGKIEELTQNIEDKVEGKCLKLENDLTTKVDEYCLIQETKVQQWCKETTKENQIFQQQLAQEIKEIETVTQQQGEKLGLVENKTVEMQGNLLITRRELDDIIVQLSKREDTIKTSIRTEINQLRKQQPINHHATDTYSPNNWIKPHLWPKFKGNGDRIHPLTFLKTILHYTQDISDDQVRLNIIRTVLQDRAMEWAEMTMDKCDTIEDFKQAFVKQYWGSGQQDRLKIQLMTGRYLEGTNSRENYAIDLFNKCKYLEAFDEAEIAKYLLNHFLLVDQHAIIGQDVKNIDQLIEFLRKLDDLELAKRRNRVPMNYRNTYTHNSYNQPHSNATYNQNNNNNHNNHPNHTHNSNNYNSNNKSHYQSRPYNAHQNGNNNFYNRNHNNTQNTSYHNNNYNHNNVNRSNNTDTTNHPRNPNHTNQGNRQENYRPNDRKPFMISNTYVKRDKPKTRPNYFSWITRKQREDDPEDREEDEETENQKEELEKKNADCKMEERQEPISYSNHQCPALIKTITISHTFPDKTHTLIYDNPQNFVSINDNNEHTELKTGLPYIYIKIQNVNIKSIIDTAAEVSLIKYTKIQNIENLNQYLIKIQKIDILATNKRKIGETKQKLSIPVKIEDITITLEFYLFDLMYYESIIGMDNLRTIEAKINFETNKIEIGDKKIKLKYTTNGHEILNIMVQDIFENEERSIYDEGIEGNKVTEENREKGELYSINDNDYYSNENDNIRLCKMQAYYGGNNLNNGTEFTKNILKDGTEITQNIMNGTKFTKKYLKELLKESELKKDVEEELTKILLRYKKVYNEEITFARNYFHRIEVTDESPLKNRNYPIPYHYREQVEEEIKEMLRQKVIERGTSHFINPVVIVKKSNGNLRLCLDLRELNTRCLDAFETSMPIDCLLTNCSNAKIFSKLDLKSAFWLIPLEPESKKYCAFKINGNVYQFTCAPFGSKSSPAALLRFLHKILNQHEKFCIHYFDDILIFSEDIENHLKHVNIIIQTLETNGMKINLEKCTWFVKEIKYLGHVIDEKGLKLDDSRLEEIENYPRPRKLKDVRAYLGLLNYYNKFIPNYTEKTLPLLHLLKKQTNWKWETAQEKAFQDLKEVFIHNLRLHHPDFSKTFIVRVDASNNAIAGELVQFQDELEVPIYFISRALRPAEVKYGITEKEMLSIVFAITKLRYFLLGKRFILETDHQALVHVMNQRLNNNRIYRWSLLLNEYDFEIRHKPGKEMIAADILSRKYENRSNPEVIITNTYLKSRGICSKQKLKEIQFDPEIEKIKRRINEIGEFQEYLIEDNYLKKKVGNKKLFVLNQLLTEELTQFIHTEYGHIGYRKTWLLFREAMYCKNDQKIMKKIIKRCQVCQIKKERNFHHTHQTLNILAHEKLDIITIDYLTNLPKTSQGYRHILVVYDIFSKFVKLYPTQRTDTDNTITHLEQFYLEHGTPKKILSDNATYFNNERFIQNCALKGIQNLFTSIRHPNANPTERCIKEIVKHLRIILEDNHTLWKKNLKQIEFYINHTPSTIHEETPIFIMKQEYPQRPWCEVSEDKEIQARIAEVKRKLETRKIKWENKRNAKKSNWKEYKLGEKVLVKNLRVTDLKNKQTAKFQKLLIGPYLITKKFGKTTYQLTDLNTNIQKGNYHISSLYDYIE